MQKDQKSRLDKSLIENFFLLNSKFDSNKLVLKISGSTFNIYTIEICNLKINCDCSDNLIRCRSLGIFCKHICFVYKKIGKIEDNNFFINKVLTQTEYNQILNRLHDTENKCDQLTDLFNNLVLNVDSKEEVKARNIDDDCPICYEILNKQKIIICKKCQNAVHQSCWNLWSQQKNTCVFCRNIVQIHKKMNSNYINLNTV